MADLPERERDGDGGAARNMSLRDYFAGQALMGMLCNPLVAGLGKPLGGEPYAQFVAGAAYEFADAMIAEGSK